MSLGKEEQMQSCDRVGTSSEMRRDKLNDTRYFIIKSLNHENLQLSIKKGIWATQAMNEPILEEAFQNSGKVILIFSVNMSGFFQGYAQMMSSISRRRDRIWSQGSGKSNSWGHSFKVQWLRLHDLPFQKTLHLKNPLNGLKPVKISRDCQELPEDIGKALCELLDEGDDTEVNFKRDEITGENFSTRRPYIEPFHSIKDEDFSVPPIQMAPVLYPSLLYQFQADESRIQLPHQRASVMLSNSSIGPAVPNVKQLKHSQIHGSLASGVENSSQFNNWGLGLPGERIPVIGTLTDDDILGMTYEEYVEAHTQGSRRFHYSASGRSSSAQKSSSSKERSEDSHSASSSKKRTYSQCLE